MVVVSSIKRIMNIIHKNVESSKLGIKLSLVSSRLLFANTASETIIKYVMTTRVMVGRYDLVILIPNKLYRTNFLL